jgi:predicted site-specific integrase-resolvase
MSLLKSWCTLDEAESKLGISKSLILKWVEEGIVRSEDYQGKVIRVNLDDREIKVAEMVKM